MFVYRCTVLFWSKSFSLFSESSSKKLRRWMWTKIKYLNLFKSNSDQPGREYYERLFSWIYIGSVISTFIILIFYISIRENINSYTVHDLTETSIKDLYETYPNTLRCPCASYSMHYDKFISVNLSFHQICTSQFISNVFIDQFWTLSDTRMHLTDFAQLTGPYFSSMASLCKMFNGLIWFLLNAFRTSLFATANLLSPANLESEANKLLNTFRDRISEASTILYEHTVDAQALVQSLDVTMSSFNLSITSNGSIQIHPVTLDNCSCVLNSHSCSKQAGLFIREASDQSLQFLSTPDGINVGCLPMLSLFHSTLACWYSEECYRKVIHGANY